MSWTWIISAAFAATASPPSAHAQPSPALLQQRAAIAQQRASVRRQAETVSLWMLPWSDAPRAADPPPCDPIADDVVSPMIESAARTEKVEPKLIRAVVERESAFRPCAVSEKGAQGLMQLMPETAQELQVQDPFDPRQNIQAGAKYLKQLLDKYKGDLPHALAAYNAGPNTVDQSSGIPDIPETRDYVNAILEKLGIRPAADQH